MFHLRKMKMLKKYLEIKKLLNIIMIVKINKLRKKMKKKNNMMKKKKKKKKKKNL